MIPLYKPYMPEDLSELNMILYSGALSYGKWGREFEISLKKNIGCEEVPLAVNSFSSAVQLVLLTLGIKSGDEIIASPLSCLASTQPLLSTGAIIKWADIDPVRGTLDPGSVRKQISNKTKLIWHNHHCGYPGFIDDINLIAHQAGIFVVDDCIEAFGAEYDGNKLGNVGTDITVFSFQTVRLPNTIDGGAVIFRDEDLKNIAIRIRDLGVDRTTFRDSSGEINPKSDVDVHGLGMTCNEVSSYIGYKQLEDVERLLESQRANAALWDNYIEKNGLNISPIITDGSSPNYWVYGVLCDNKEEMVPYFRNLGYYASGVHVPNTCYSIFKNRDELLGVEEFYRRFFALPCGWWLKNSL